MKHIVTGFAVKCSTTHVLVHACMTYHSEPHYLPTTVRMMASAEAQCIIW